ncbi:uncharacterized protein B0H64DRAFT_435137 [Chaetomium fimeti]|uniref:Uncharacterized protein n=1 Tax=Chaetomium fimeti TaxID=1854472 RepID=A0AAE0LPD6_9PEZI|nr:hypothetical protein B0H64DRAFT_435137 [Chaetomium fimeti]
MKASFFTLLTIAASALATPLLAPRQLESQAAQLDQLTELVRAHTANINATTTAVQDNPTIDQQNEAAAALAPDFDAITAALTSATTTLAKRAWAATRGDDDDDGHDGGDGCPEDCLLVKIQVLVWEVGCTLRFVIVKLGLACVLGYLKPLLLALVGLVKALDKVVLGALVLVKSLLHTVLGAVAAALLELVFV